MRSGIAVVALVDHEGLAQARHVDLVGPQQVDDLDVARLGTRQDRRQVASPRARQETQIEPGDPSGRAVQDVETVPTLCDHAVAFGNLPRQRRGRRPHRAAQRAHADHDHRPIGRAQDLGEGALTGRDRLQDWGPAPR